MKDSLKTVKQDSIVMAVLDGPILYSSDDSIKILPDSGRIFLFGNATVKYQAIELQAEIIEINYTANLKIGRAHV